MPLDGSSEGKGSHSDPRSGAGPTLRTRDYTGDRDWQGQGLITSSPQWKYSHGVRQPTQSHPEKPEAVSSLSVDVTLQTQFPVKQCHCAEGRRTPLALGKSPCCHTKKEVRPGGGGGAERRGRRRRAGGRTHSRPLHFLASVFTSCFPSKHTGQGCPYHGITGPPSHKPKMARTTPHSTPSKVARFCAWSPLHGPFTHWTPAAGVLLETYLSLKRFLRQRSGLTPPSDGLKPKGTEPQLFPPHPPTS